MQVTSISIEINGKTYEITRNDDPSPGFVRIDWPEQGCIVLAATSRAECVVAATEIATDAYGTRRRGGGPNCTNSDLGDIADAVQRVAGC